MSRNQQKGEIQIAGFAHTRLIISIFHHLIGQHFESGILFISASQFAWRRKIIRRVGAKINLSWMGNETGTKRSIARLMGTGKNIKIYIKI